MSKEEIYDEINHIFCYSRYYKDSALCVKCFLDGVPNDEKISNEQTNSILEILGK